MLTQLRQKIFLSLAFAALAIANAHLDPAHTNALNSAVAQASVERIKADLEARAKADEAARRSAEEKASAASVKTPK